MNYITTTDLKGAAGILHMTEDKARSLLKSEGIEPDQQGQYLEFKVQSVAANRKWRGYK